ncbi:hypothetical protein [Vibrio sp. TRT 29B02]|uniref:hypothetical protein n=1 Tax=Vibrio sp. TRT 29B02 TaxID=3418508 RepID=UPI003CE7213F
MSDIEANQTMYVFLADVQHKYNKTCSLFRQRHRNELTEIANTYRLRADMLRKLNLVSAHIAPSSEAESFIKRALNNSILAGEISPFVYLVMSPSSATARPLNPKSLRLASLTR